METFAGISLRHPLATLGVLALITLACAAGLPRLGTDVGYRAFLGSQHPAVREFDAFVERFGAGLPILAVWSCAETERCDSVFDPGALTMADAVAHALEADAGVIRVESPATSVIWLPTPEGFDPRRLMRDGVPTPDRALLAARARIDPSWVGSLISADGTVGAVAAELASSDSATSVRVYDVLDRALAPFEAQGFRFHRVGGPVEFVVAGGELESAAQRLIPVMVGLVGIVIWLLHGSAVAALAVLASVGLSVLWTLGLLGWLGWPQNSITQTLPPLVLVIGVCDAIHLLSRYASETAARQELDRRTRTEALLRVSRDIGAPCVVTTLTTAGGLLAFAASELESFVRFGFAAAFGVTAALLLTFSLLPILLQAGFAGRLRGSTASQRWDHRLNALVDFSGRRARPLLLGAGAVGVACAYGMASLEVDASFEDLYGEHSRVVGWAHFVEENLRRPDTLELEIRLPEAVAFEEPATIQRIADVSRLLPELDGLGRARSVLGPLAWVNRVLHDDDPAYQRPGDNARANAQLLLLLSLEDRATTRPWLSADQRRVRISVEASKAPQGRLRRLFREVRERLGEALPEDWGVALTGPLAIVFEMIEAIKRTQLRTFAVAAAVVFGLVAVLIRSPGWALLAMVPTALPVVATLGAMGFLGVHLDVGTAMVAATVIGIAVDDAVHLLSQYRRRTAVGQSASDAIREAVPHVGRALVTTSLALALGFFALNLSPWKSVASFGLVAGIAILAALVAVLVLLPALILSVARFSRH